MIYRFMLAFMQNDQKFTVCAQLVTTLLSAFVDSEEKVGLPDTVDEPAGQVLADALSLLCCKEMRICFTTQKATQDDDCDGEGLPTAADKASVEATRGVLSSILKRNMCENVVPVMIQLKNVMEAQHSPFLRQLRHCLREILKDFKDDLQDMLAGDAQLANEIAFDLQELDAGSKNASKEAPIPKQGAVVGGGASRRISIRSIMKTGVTDSPNKHGSPVKGASQKLPACSPIKTPLARPLDMTPKLPGDHESAMSDLRMSPCGLSLPVVEEPVRRLRQKCHPESASEATGMVSPPETKRVKIGALPETKRKTKKARPEK